METDVLVAENLEWAVKLVAQYVIPSLDKEDVAQEALLALTKAAQSFDVTRNVPFQGYAHRVITNHLNSVYGHWGRRANQITVLDEPISGTGETAKDEITDSDVLPDQEAYRDEVRRALTMGMNSLSANQNAILEAFSQGESFEEISQRIGVSRQAVRQSMERAIKQLRPQLENQGIRGVQFMPSSFDMSSPAPFGEISLPSSPLPRKAPPSKRRNHIIAFVVLLIVLLLGVILLLEFV